MEFSGLAIVRFSSYLYLPFLLSLCFHLVYFLIRITDFLIQIQHLRIVLLWKFQKRWRVVALICGISPCILKFWVRNGSLICRLSFFTCYIVKVVAVSAISVGYCIAHTSLVVIREVSVVLNFLMWNFIIFMGNFADLLLILFNHSAHNRLGSQVEIPIIESFSINCCQALVNQGVSLFRPNFCCIKYKILCCKQMLWGCWSGCCFLGLEHLFTIMKQLYFLRLI